MKGITVVAALVLFVLCALLLWSSNDFDQRFSHAPFKQSSWGASSRTLLQLAMTFAHADHAKQQCAACHHNYLDDSGQGLCLDCHRSDQQIAFKMRAQFHSLCMGCHMDKRADGEVSGPMRNCKACHTADDAP